MERLQDWIAQAEMRLQQAGVLEYKNDAWLLWEKVSGMNRTQYLLRKADFVDDSGEYAKWKQLYDNMLERRAKREPLQHILGVQSFYGYEYLVDGSVLIPRMDTERLVEEALKKMQQMGKIELSCLDLCTGSGCIAISVKKEAEKSGIAVDMTAVDLSEAALQTAAKNADRLACEVTFVQSDLFENLQEQRFDYIISNPPYIPTDVIEGLSEEVKRDPYMALDGDRDGLRFYRAITVDAWDYLKEDGYLLYEIGHDQGEAVSEMMRERGFTDVCVKKDYGGLDRIVIGKRKVR